MNVYSATDIDVVLHQTFTIALESNPTTGYTWKSDYDLAVIELVRQDFALQSNAIGGGGEETFEFRALQAGETQVKMSYQREGKDQPLEMKLYRVHIKQ